MSVQPKSLELLDKARFPADQARAIVGAIEIEIDGARDTLATKQDVLLLRQDVESVRKDLEGARNDVEGVRKDVEGLRREMGDLRDGLKGEIKGVRGELLAEINISANRSTRQLLASTLTLMSMLGGIFYFLLTHSVR